MHVVIAGLGLIGGSLGMALRKRGWQVSYCDPAVSLDAARRAGAADQMLDVPRGELVVLATPIDVALTLLSSGDVVTTTASVMTPFRGSNVVAGHPFAGSEQSGLAGARADLFEEKTWFVDRDHERVRRMIEDAGAKQVVIDAAAHDEALALTSHLPQMISTALASLIEQKKIDPVFMGTGLRTLLRLAGSSHDVWKPVFDSNAANVRAAMKELMQAMETLDADAFARAQTLYRKLN